MAIGQDLSKTIGLIYDCALDPSAWPAALGAMRARTDFATGVLDLMTLPEGKSLLAVSDGIPEPWLSRQTQYGSEAVRMWGGHARMLSYPLEEPVVLSQVNPDGLRDNRFVTDWSEPQGLVDTLGIALFRDPKNIGYLGFGRHRDAGPIGEREVAELALFVPHVKRAITISRLLDVQALRAADLESVIGRLNVAVLFVGEGLRLLHANPAAERLMASGGPLILRAGVVSAGPDAGKAAGVALARTREVGGQTSFWAPVKSAEGNAHVLHVLPLGFGRRRSELVPGAVAAILVSHDGAPRLAPVDAVAALYDLTRTEARVLAGIATGHASATVAAELGIGLSTVRTHLLRVFDKTGTHRQAELVVLVNSLTLPLDL